MTKQSTCTALHRKGERSLSSPLARSRLRVRRLRGISFRLRNVGAGAALAVEARWAFDAIDFAAVVAKCDPEVGRNISVEDDLVRFDVQGNGLSWMAREAQEHHLGALSASPEKAVDVPLPFAYTFLASAYFNGLLSQGLQAALQSALPPLTLAVSFRDRAGSEHQSTYRVELNLFYLSTGGIPVGDAVAGLTSGAECLRCALPKGLCYLRNECHGARGRHHDAPASS